MSTRVSSQPAPAIPRGSYCGGNVTTLLSAEVPICEMVDEQRYQIPMVSILVYDS
jgi:hypothetical protein